MQTTARNNQYSKEIKETIVREHFKAGTPIKQLARKYNVPAHETVRSRIFKYTEGEEIRSYTPKPEVYTMKSRKITQAENLALKARNEYLETENAALKN
ncbi:MULTISPECIES: transposase [Bacillati]|uniref:transposase n=1 Tax=Bacillati TaxID=1783272 RepID=UPI0036EC1EE5